MSLDKKNQHKENQTGQGLRAREEKEEKRKTILYRIGGWAAGIMIVGGLIVMLGMSAKNAYDGYQSSKLNYDSDSMVVSDMTGILTQLESESSAESSTEKSDAKTSDSKASAETESAKATESATEAAQ